MDRTSANQTYRKALQMAEKKGQKQVKATLAHLGRTDLFFMLTQILGRVDADRDWLYDRTREVESSPDGHLDLWAREHYKSTIITFAKTIQDIINDPEITVGIFSHTRPIAKAFLRQIKRELESNKLLQQLYPDALYVEPHKESPKWSEDDGLIVKRRGNPNAATIEAWGLVDGQPTSKHYRLLIYDDVVTRESVTNPDMIKKTTDAWELSLNLGMDGGAKRYIGTRYHFADTYRTIMQRHAAVPRIYPATVDGTMDGKPVLLSPEALAEKRRDMGPYTFGCQMLQDPIADKAQGFKTEWLNYWTPKDWSKMNRYLLCDPAGEKKKENDYTVMVVIGLAADQNYYLIDGLRDRLNLAERTRALIGLHRQYTPQMTGYEKYGKDSDIEAIKQEQERQNYRFPIVALGGAMPKTDRIKRLIPLFEGNRFYLPTRCPFIDQERKYRDLTREFVDEEYSAFPVGLHDDVFDCMARVTDPQLKAAHPKTELDARMMADPQNSAARTDYQLFGRHVQPQGQRAQTTYQLFGRQ